jgi:hypothetical protein
MPLHKTHKTIAKNAIENFLFLKRIPQKYIYIYITRLIFEFFSFRIQN